MGIYLALQISQLPRRAVGWVTMGLHTQISFRLKSSESESDLVSGNSSKSRILTYSKVPLTDEQENLLKKWREHPAINPTLVFPTLLIPSEHLQRVIQDSRIEPYLAKPSNWAFLHQVHPRIKLVQEYNDTSKQLLLLYDENNDHVINKTAGVSMDLLKNIGLDLNFGPDLEIPINFRQLSFGYILSRLLPVAPPSAYEQIGHVAHFNLKSQHAPYGELIGQVLRETNPSIDTVVSKVGEVKGKYRTYDLDVLAGPENFETTVVEHGISIRLNVAHCYWSTRLSGERQELIDDIERSIDMSKNESLVVADVFCGVGAVCMLLAKNNPRCTILANDWNSKAIECLKESLSRNGLDRTEQFHVSCGDAYDFMIELGTDRPAEETPDHVLMNFPLEASSFLGSLRWWSSKVVAEKFRRTKRYPRFHVYTFARASTKGLDDEEEVAVNIIADQLMPDMGEHNESRYRRDELNKDFGADVQTRLVRDVAPGKVVVCVSFCLTPLLIRYMQGDYNM
jgi:tRNA G37 N-methylase Trm5